MKFLFYATLPITFPCYCVVSIINSMYIEVTRQKHLEEWQRINKFVDEEGKSESIKKRSRVKLTVVQNSKEGVTCD